MKSLFEQKLLLVRQEELIIRLKNNVDNLEISDESFNDDLLNLCKINQFLTKPNNSESRKNNKGL